MSTLYFEKISQFDRVAEPVTVSIPFAKGALTDPRCLLVRDGGTALAGGRPIRVYELRRGLLGLQHGRVEAHGSCPSGPDPRAQR